MTFLLLFIMNSVIIHRSVWTEIALGLVLGGRYVVNDNMRVA
jgi:hypothetical protein